MKPETFQRITHRVEELKEKRKKAVEQNGEPLTESEMREFKQKSGKQKIWRNNLDAERG